LNDNNGAILICRATHTLVGNLNDFQAISPKVLMFSHALYEEVRLACCFCDLPPQCTFYTYILGKMTYVSFLLVPII
jgi:hypothetical protein